MLEQKRTSGGQIFPSPQKGAVIEETPPVFSFLREKFFLSSRGYKVNSLHADEIFFTFGIVETILAGSDHGCINVRKIFPDPKTKGVPIEVIHRKYQSTWAGKGPLLSF